MRHVLLLLAFLISGTIPQPVYAYQDTVCHVMTSDSVRLYVHVKGEGPMCLYLHGGPGSGSTWMEAVSGHILEKRFTMVYLDQRGVCKSETPKNDDFSFARQIQDWEEVRQALGIGHWLLMGHSWGGILMMGYWKAHPNVIDGMMFFNCTLSRDTSFGESWLPRAISILGDTASPVAKDESRPLKERMMAVFPQLNDDNRWMLFTPNKWANDSIGSWRFHKDCISHGKGETPLFMDEYGEDFRPLTSAIKVPVLYLYGRQDYAVGPDHYKTLHFPNAVVLGADCGHMVFLEKPAVFAEALDKFCQLLLTPINGSTSYGACIMRDGSVSGINENERFALHSVMKFPQALYIADYLSRKGLALDDTIVVDKTDLMQDTWSPMLKRFEGKMAFSYAELLELSLGQSDNNACELLFKYCGKPKAIEKYMRKLGFHDIHVRMTEKQMHKNPTKAIENSSTPAEMARLFEWFYHHKDDNQYLTFIWKAMADCSTGLKRIPAAIPEDARIVHKTGTGFPLPEGVQDMNDAGFILMPDGGHVFIAVFTTNSPSETVVADIARQLLERIRY